MEEIEKMSTKMAQKARTGLMALVIERVEGACRKDVWDSTIEHSLKGINSGITAAKALHAPDIDGITPFTDEQHAELKLMLKHLSDLNMIEEMREVLVEALVKQGFDQKIFEPKANAATS